MAKGAIGEREVWFSETFKLNSDQWWAKAMRKSDGLALRRRHRLAVMSCLPFVRLETVWRLDRLYAGGFDPVRMAVFRNEETAARLFDEICSEVEAMLAAWNREVDALPPLVPDP